MNKRGSWAVDHPLFRKGAFLLPTLDRQGNPRPLGWYNPIVDSIFLSQQSQDIWQHEATHRIFSVFGGDFILLRILAGISHTLLRALLEMARKGDIRIYGKRLGKIQIKGAGQEAAQLILERLEQAEVLYDTVFFSVLPMTEIAAIDFIPAEETHTWPLIYVDEKENTRKWKAKLVHLLAELLVQAGRYGRFYEDIRGELLRTWEKYDAIEDPITRRNLLQLVMSSSIDLDAGKESGSLVDTAGIIPVDVFALVQELTGQTSETGIRNALRKNANQRIDQTWDHSETLIDLAFKNMPEMSLEPLKNTHAMALLLLYSATRSKDLLPHEGTENATEALHGLRSLFVFQMEPNGPKRVEVNPVFLSIIERQWMSDEWALEENWWRQLALSETLRQTIKTGKLASCPFQGWDGVDCDDGCLIRNEILWLGKQTDLSSESAVCSL